MLELMQPAKKKSTSPRSRKGQVAKTHGVFELTDGTKGTLQQLYADQRRPQELKYRTFVSRIRRAGTRKPTPKEVFAPPGPRGRPPGFRIPSIRAPGSAG